MAAPFLRLARLGAEGAQSFAYSARRPLIRMLYEVAEHRGLMPDAAGEERRSREPRAF